MEVQHKDRRVFHNSDGLIEYEYKGHHTGYVYEDEDDFLADVRVLVEFAQKMGVEEFDAVVV